ncbi:MAG: T9SS C-terminal target domain-containing protein [Porphyromonadaceae bacterium]|nr:MAG: T9SS C-terminal target domain-containing protein [Porphyromonadaceae bacterium]
MKNKHLLFALALVLSVGFTAFGQVAREGKVQLTGDGNQTVKDLDPMNPANWLNARRVNQYSGTINIADIVRAQEQVKALSRKGGNSLNMSWNEIGPNNIGGRTRAFLIDKDNPDVCFAGSVSGGLWKTTTGGTSWEKTKTASGELFENLAVSSICQASNGDIYFGTGEGPATTLGNIQDAHQGILGQGIWKSTDHGVTFSRLESTWSTTESKEAFVLVYALSADPTNASKLYAATTKGLRVSTDGGQSWANPMPDNTTAIAFDVKVASDGTVVTSVGNVAYRSANGDAGSFTKVSAVDGLKNKLIQDKDVSRMMFAFSPGDPNYVYCVAVGTTKSGTTITGYPMSNIYQSKDKGLTWSVIGPGGSGYFQPLGTEGNYASAIDVDPSDPGFIMIGGKDMYSWSYKTGWERVTLDEPMELLNRGFYVHRDQHIIAFSKTDPNTVFVGTSGGVTITNNKGRTWRTLNRNYNVTQFMTIAFSPKGEILGGSMDNGILAMDFQGNDPKYASWWGGSVFSFFLNFRHGGDCEISTLDPSYKYYTTPGGVVHRRMIVEGQTSYQEYYGVGNGGPWLTPMTMWESFNDVKSWDTVRFIADRDYAAGETVVAQSLIKKLPLRKVLTQPLANGDTLKIQDTYQSMIAFGKNGTAGIRVNRHPLSGLDSYKVTYAVIITKRLQSTPNVDQVISLAFSHDGNYLYGAVWDGSEKKYKIYRIANLENARDRRRMDTLTGFDPITGQPLYVETTATIGSFTQVVTSIAVDPADPNNVLVSTGNYGNPNFIYRCTNATTARDSTENFTAIQGNLPQAPVYSILYNARNNNEVMVGTEYGVYSTSDIYAGTPEWASENRNGMEIVPVFQIRQQKFDNNAEFGIENHGVVYAATFGRGIFTSETFASKGGSSSSKLAGISNIDVKITPNPVSDVAIIRYNMENNSNIDFQIYDLQGKLVKTINLSNQPAGANELSIDASAFGAGTYLIRMTAGTQQASSKFVVK